MIIGLIFLGGIPYLEKNDDIKATWNINYTVEMTWQGNRFGVPLHCKRIYELRSLFNIGKEQLYNMFFEEVNYKIKEFTEKLFMGRSNYVAPPEGFKPDLATLNEIITKTALNNVFGNPLDCTCINYKGGMKDDA